MKVVFFDFVTQYGGAPRSTIEFAGRLSLFADVTIVDPYGSCGLFAQAVRVAGLRYVVLSPGASRVIIGGSTNLWKRVYALCASMPGLWRIRRLARQRMVEIRPDVVICNNPKSLAMLATLLGMRVDFSLVAYLRGWFTPDQLPFYARVLYRRRCSHLLAVSRATQSALICASFRSQAITVLRNPIDVPALTARAMEPLSAALPGFGADHKLLLAANLLPGKGQHVGVAALAALVQRNHDCVLWIAGGTGPGSDVAYVEDVRQAVEQLGLANRVFWLGVRDDVPRLIRESTVVILPSTSEGLPRVLMEAMALRRPVVATIVGGVADLILPEVTGLEAAVGDPESLAAQVERFLTEPELGERITEAAYAYISSSFRPELQTQIALDTFTRLIEGRGS